MLSLPATGRDWRAFCALLLALLLLPALLVASTTETGGSEALRPAAAPLAADPCDLDMVTCDSGSTR